MQDFKRSLTKGVGNGMGGGGGAGGAGGGGGLNSPPPQILSSCYVYKQLDKKDVQKQDRKNSFQVISSVTHTKSKLRSVQIYMYEFGSH